ncbi:uncharacterized protein LOC113437239 [Pseudonaja textilis]|uniref:uncharacterized protein LOC113437239 n=1 Tax=Pseudonaja textilis TaxID=8673 RepID=UPI000EA942E8|nr:uncharacterized protein LOC113437239 [Pseudonaja textilis]
MAASCPALAQARWPTSEYLCRGQFSTGAGSAPRTRRPKRLPCPFLFCFVFLPPPSQLLHLGPGRSRPRLRSLLPGPGGRERLGRGCACALRASGSGEPLPRVAAGENFHGNGAAGQGAGKGSHGNGSPRHRPTRRINSLGPFGQGSLPCAKAGVPNFGYLKTCGLQLPRRLIFSACPKRNLWVQTIHVALDTGIAYSKSKCSFPHMDFDSMRRVLLHHNQNQMSQPKLGYHY